MHKRRPPQEQPVRPVSPPTSKRAKTGTSSTVTAKAVQNFFKPTSQKGSDRLSWRIVDDSLLVGHYKTPEDTSSPNGPPAKRRKIAAFDFDGTLISTSSGSVFGRTAEDWKWWDRRVPEKLQTLHADGYQIAVVSNQGGLNLAGKEVTAAKTKKLNDFKTKVGYALIQLDLPIMFYAAGGRDIYRKPRTGIWKSLLDDLDLDEPTEDTVDLENSFFVGDAAGRLPRGKIKRDFSTCDRDFAENIGLRFYTPEEYFLGHKALPWERQFNPQEYIGQVIQSEAAIPQIEIDGGSMSPAFEKKHNLEIVIFVGSPGSGKSTFYRTHLEPLGYSRANQDTLKTKDKCLKFARESIADGKPVAVDNTNADKATREDWVNLAEELEVPIRCIWLKAPLEICQHNDTIRSLHSNNTWNPEQRQMLPKMAFGSFQSRFQQPALEEGLGEIMEIPFKFTGSEEMKALWGKHWT